MNYRVRPLPLELHLWVIVIALIVFDLFADVLFDHLLIESGCAHKVASCPELFLEDGFALGELVVEKNGTLALEESDDGSDTVFWWDPQHHVHVIDLDRPFDDLDTLLSGKFSEDLSKDIPNGTEEDFLSVFGSEHHVICAIPPHVGLGMERVGHTKEVKEHPQLRTSHIHDISNAGDSRTPWSLPGRAGGLLR